MSDLTEGPVAVWGSPNGTKPKLTEDVWRVELSVLVSTLGAYDRHGEPVREPKTEEDVLAMVRGYFGLNRDAWPRWLRLVEVDAIYDANEDEDD